MSKPTTLTELLKSHENELVKQYQELDGQGRVSRIYTAMTFAKTGDPCLVTELIYVNPTSTTVLGRKEGHATWDVAWIPDSLFTVSE